MKPREIIIGEIIIEVLRYIHIEDIGLLIIILK
jgi:hypothetical protein